MKVINSMGEIVLEKEVPHVKTARMSSVRRHPRNTSVNKNIHPIVVSTEEFLSQIPVQSDGSL